MIKFRFVFGHVASLFLVSLICHAGVAQASNETLTILNWEDYIEPGVVGKFERANKVKVKQILFDEEADIVPLLEKHRGEVDLVVASTLTMNKLKARGFLLPLNKGMLANTRLIKNRWQSDSDYVVPYTWGTTGFAWRSDRLQDGPKNWTEFFALVERFPGKVALISDPEEYLLAAHFALGNDRPFRTSQEVKDAAEYVRGFGDKLRYLESDTSESNPLVSGDLVLMQAWNGDAAFLHNNHDARIKYVIPESGCMIWQDSFAINVNAPSPKLAHGFINFLNEGRIVGSNASYLGYASSNPLALLYADGDYVNDPIIRPSLAGLDDCYFYDTYPEAVSRAINNR